MLRMVGGTRSLVPGVPKFEIFVLFFCREVVSLHVRIPGTHQHPWLYFHRMIYGLDGG